MGYKYMNHVYLFRYRESNPGLSGNFFLPMLREEMKADDVNPYTIPDVVLKLDP